MARIFIALRFSDETKRQLVALQDALRERGVRGNYCPYGNLHMTLAFIGEHYDLSSIFQAVSEVEFVPFRLSLSNLGSFQTKAGVIWCAVKEQLPIMELASQLRQRLTAHGVKFKDQAFFPHVSLVQHPSAIITDIDMPDVSFLVDRICVMKSERIDDALVYSEVE